MIRFTFAIGSLLLVSPHSFGAQLDLDGDTDRTGAVEGSQIEESQEPSNSVIVLNNCDRESIATSQNPDNFDDRVNGPSDLEDMEPLILRQATGSISSITIKLKKLSEDSLAEDKRVRVFGTDGKEILGPSKGTTYSLSQSDLANLMTQDLTFFVEGLQFSTSVTLGGLKGRDSFFVEEKSRVPYFPQLFPCPPTKTNGKTPATQPSSGLAVCARSAFTDHEELLLPSPSIRTPRRCGRPAGAIRSVKISNA